MAKGADTPLRTIMIVMRMAGDDSEYGPIYKQRFTKSGNPSLYGRYDKHGLLRSLDYDYNGEYIGERDNYNYGDDESSGELPEDYFVYQPRDDAYDPQPQQQQPPPSLMMTMNTNICAMCLSQAEMRETQEIRNTLNDIKAIIMSAHPSDCGAQSSLKISMIRAIIDGDPGARQSLKRKLEEETATPPTTVVVVEDATRPMDKKARYAALCEEIEASSNIDLEYRERRGKTDCFTCRLCDPLRLRPISIEYWRPHCLIVTHAYHRENDVTAKKLRGLI